MNTAKQELAKKALLIVNPVAGRKLIQKTLTQVVRTLMDRGYLVTTAISSRRGEAEEFARDFGEEYDLIVCAGGDGTLNECLSGMARREIIRPFGYIPCGSTNDFALSHNLSTDILQAAEAAAGGNERALDIGCFSERFFLHHALFGAFTSMAYSTDQTQKNLLGFGAYVLDGLKQIPTLKPIPMCVSADGLKEEGEYLFGAVSVNKSIAGIYLLPEENIGETDGNLAAVLIKVPKTVADWDVLGRSLLSGDPNCSMVKVLYARELRICSPEGLEYSLDGESSGPRTEVLFSVKRGFLHLRA